MAEFRIPYDRQPLAFRLPDEHPVEVIAPVDAPAAPDPVPVVQAALDHPVGGVSLSDFSDARSVAIAINDKTRPVPHEYLLPPLLARLEGLGLPPEAITLIIATGAHPPMLPEEFRLVVPAEVLARHAVICHDCDDREGLVYLGQTARGTPAWMNRRFVEADLRLVVGNIEPHQFMGFSGGVKSAAIGLAGRDTINRNHAMLTEPGARLGEYENNPPRQDVEAIGRMAGVHWALNAIINRQKQIVAAVAGQPRAVMDAGIPLARQHCQVTVREPYDLVIASPGGYPKDLNLYQAQKALAHAALVTKPGGTVILVAACPEGVGSRSYEQWMLERPMGSYQEVCERFAREGFRVGPHKAFLVARDASRARVLLVSEMEPGLVRRLLLTPVASLEEALSLALADLPAEARLAILPAASATVPVLRDTAMAE